MTNKVMFIDPIDLNKKTEINVENDTKILHAARKAKVPIRYGCASCRCGTCAVRVEPANSFAPMEEDEKALLEKMKLDTSVGDIRLSCRAKVIGSATVHLDFQDTYDPVSDILG